MKEKDIVGREQRVCRNCHHTVTGRSDKIFCSDACRTEFNNRRSRYKLKSVHKIDRILKKNRSIIDELYSEGHTNIALSVLYSLGFNFQYITSLKASKNPEEPCFIGCFDYDYCILEDGTVNLYKKTIPP